MVASSMAGKSARKSQKRRGPSRDINPAQAGFAGDTILLITALDFFERKKCIGLKIIPTNYILPVHHLFSTQQTWDTHHQFSIKTLLSKQSRLISLHELVASSMAGKFGWTLLNQKEICCEQFFFKFLLNKIFFQKKNFQTIFF